jgi:hypothetical protein
MCFVYVYGYWLSHRHFCTQAGSGDLLNICCLLNRLLHLLPCFIPAAINGNVIPGLVHVLRGTRMDNGSGQEGPVLTPRVPKDALICIHHVMLYDMDHGKGLWKTAVDAGIVPVLVHLLTPPDESTIDSTLAVSEMVLMSAPQGETGGWGLALLRACARLLCASPQVAGHNVVEMLHNVGTAHPALLMGWQTWGIDDGLQQLTMHRDPGTAAAALGLQMLLPSCIKGPDVSPVLPCTEHLLLFPSLTTGMRWQGVCCAHTRDIWCLAKLFSGCVISHCGDSCGYTM